MAWYLANRQSRRVALVDLDLQNGDCALALDIKPTSGLREALANPLRIDNTLLERVMTPVGERLFVLSSEEPLSEDLHFTAVAVETLVSALREQFHYVIVDVPRIPAAPYRRALDMADFRVTVADQTLRSVRDTVRLRAAIGEGDGKRRNILVVNRHGEGGRHAVTLQEMQHVVEVKPKSVIPFQPTLFTTISGGAKIAAAQRGKFTDAIAALALELSGRPPERRRWWRAEKMRSAGFGRRIVEPSGHELVLIPGQEAPSRAARARQSRRAEGADPRRADVAHRPLGGGPHPAADPAGRSRQVGQRDRDRAAHPAQRDRGEPRSPSS